MGNALAVCKETILHWKRSNAPRMGAALSYYAIFSVVPFLICIILLVGIIFTKGVVEETVISKVSELVGNELGTYIKGTLSGSIISAKGMIPAVVGTLFILIGAIGVFSELNRALDDLWMVPEEKKQPTTFLNKAWSAFREKIIVFSIVPLIGLLLLFSVSLSVFLSFFTDVTPAVHSLFKIIELLASFLLSTVLFALIYKLLPNTKLPWKEVFLGALITALLFIIGRSLILLYLHTFAHLSLYGSAGAVIALLIWIYYSAQVFFLGASFIFVYSQRYGFLSKQKSRA